MNLHWSWQCGRVCPFRIIDGITSQPYPLTAQTVVITPLAILIEECAQQTVGTVAIDENMREIQCDAVIPPGKSQQMLIGIFAEQADGGLSATEYPRLWIVIIHEVFYAFLIAHNAQFDAEIRVSLLCSLQGFMQHLLIYLVF